MTDHETAFTDLDAPLAAEYRPMSRSAWISLVITLFSFFALLSPVFWFVPFFSALAALVALRGIARSELKLSGRGLAMTALVISVVILGFAPANYFGARSLASVQARRYADAWLDLVKQEKYFEAHQLTRAVTDRQPPGADLAEHYRDKYGQESASRRRMMMEVSDPAEDLRSFLGADPVNELRASGKELEVVYRSASVLTQRSSGKLTTIVQLRYDALLPVAGGTKTMPFVIAMAREIEHASRQAHWRVQDVSQPK